MKIMDKKAEIPFSLLWAVLFTFFMNGFSSLFRTPIKFSAYFLISLIAMVLFLRVYNKEK